MSQTSRRQPDLTDPGPVRLADPPPGAGHIIEPMLSIDDMAGILKCSRRWLERERSAGRVPRPDFRAGKCPRWYAETIRRWIGEGAHA